MASLDIQLGQLENAQLVRRVAEEELAYLFKHALTQGAAYESLLVKRRREIHRRVAEAYEQLNAEHLDEFVALLSEHYWNGEVWVKAAEWAMRAGERAMRGYAQREALGQFERALEALDKIQARAEQIIDATLGWIRPAMNFKSYDELLERLARAEKMARERNDMPRLAQILHWIADVHFANGYNTRALPPLFENYQIATTLRDERLSVVPSYWLAFFMVDRDPRAALAQFENVIDMARKHHNKEIEAHAIATKGLAHARLGEFAQAQIDLEQALELVQSVNSPIKEADVNNLAAFTYLDMGEIERALEFAQRGTKKALAVNALECASAGLVGIGMCKLHTRAPNEAQAAFDQSRRLAESRGNDILRNQAQSGLAAAQVLGGQTEAIRDLESAIGNAKAIGEQYTEAIFSQILGEIYLQQGDLERAAIGLTAALEYYRRRNMRPYLARALESAATLYDRQGRGADAARARAEAEALTKELHVAS
jgi:tetratricopeptide (TPR) repeat protein